MTTQKPLSIIKLALLIASMGIAPYADAHRGSETNTVAWQVCEGKALADYCEYQNDHHDLYKGSCQVMSEALLCVRSQPIEHHDDHDDHDDHE